MFNGVSRLLWIVYGHLINHQISENHEVSLSKLRMDRILSGFS